jgi:hypothetical protein
MYFFFIFSCLLFFMVPIILCTFLFFCRREKLMIFIAFLILQIESNCICLWWFKGAWKGLTWVDNFVYPWNFLNKFFNSFLHEKLEQWNILFSFFAIVCKVWLNVVLIIMIVRIVVHYLFNILDCFQYSQFCEKCN